MTTLFFAVMAFFIAFMVYVIADQVRMILAALKSETVQESFQKENDGCAVVRIMKTAA